MQDLKSRTKRFAIDCWIFCEKIPRSRELDAWVRQLIRSSSSVGANYRASQRAKSTADFINKLKIVEEEIDESAYWLELFLEVKKGQIDQLEKLHQESKELLAIIVSSIKTTRQRRQ
ncbi:four helix bundle protein [uncultured Croceitalea sp.]|uniref:four helix bundle protein n=1 Tax=uncultured Croceitalea sp. TaxID=1798908 RepID=UPI003305CF98